jgi:hypothetical protein
MSFLDTRWKNPQGQDIASLWRWAQDLITELRKGAYRTLPSYTVATVPPASPAGMLIYVSDETGGAVPAFSDGSDWRRVTDRAVVS